MQAIYFITTTRIVYMSQGFCAVKFVLNERFYLNLQ